MVKEHQLGYIFGMPVVVKIEANYPEQFEQCKKHIENHFMKMNDAYLEKNCSMELDKPL